VEIIYGNANIRKKCQKATGRLKRRLDDLRAADNLHVMMTLPGNCHPLVANRKGQWAVYLEHPYRLVFEPANDPLPDLGNGRLDLEKITAVRLISVEDCHG
jgi:proteic killer suppression protein